MPKRVRPKVVPFAVLLALICPIVNSQTPGPPSSPQLPNQTKLDVNPVSLDQALRLANAQAANYQNSILNESIAVEDVRQAEAAFRPKVSAPLTYLYTSPSFGLPPGEPRVQSFISNDAISQYQAFVNVSGDFDITGRLRATLAKNRALLAAAHAGTEVARRALMQAVIEAYYGLALASAQREAAEGNLRAAEEFERITSLLLGGGEVAPVDLTRAQLQTLSRRDELGRAVVTEQVAGGSIRVLIGYDFVQPIRTTELTLGLPSESEYRHFKADDVFRRPEFIQFDQQLRAAQQEIKIARAERLPSLSYSINGGFDTDSLKGPRLKEHTGVSAAISLNIPIFDWGASRSKEKQARLRAELAGNEQVLAQRAFTQDFYAARAQAEYAVERIHLNREGINKAQDNLSASIARYRAGEAPIIEVTDAQTTLVTQRTALYQAIFDYQVAIARLKLATGQ